jgi:polyhydroxyalkanoate synthesis regulator phasin
MLEGCLDGTDLRSKGTAMHLDDVRKTIEAVVGNLTPARAQELARSLLEPGTAKDQVAKTTADLIEWSQRSRERLSELVRREIQEQLRGMGVATQTELDALRKRVRTLERAAGMTASGGTRTASTRKTQARASTSRTATSKSRSKARASSATARRGAARASS